MPYGPGVPAQLHPYADTTRTEFRRIVRGQGALVFDSDGKQYFDALASLWYCNVGHGRAELAGAMAEQAQTLAGYHTFENLTNDPADRLAERLTALSPVPDSRVYFTNSGSEAIDSAMKLAYLAQSRRGGSPRQTFVSMDGAYHGMSYGGASIGGIQANRTPFGPLVPNIEHTPRNDIAAVEALFAARGDDVVAVFAEIVSGTGGVVPATMEYLQRLRELCDQYGALLVFDEVITAFGRLGAWFGTSTTPVVPDMITFAKGVTSGYLPLGGVLLGGRVRTHLEDEPLVLRHGGTYAGHPTCCATALRVLDILDGESLFAGAKRIADVLGDGLRDLERKRRITHAHGAGGMWAADLLPEHSHTRIRTEMLDRGVIARPIGANTIAFCPPLVSTEQQLDDCLATLTDVLATSSR